MIRRYPLLWKELRESRLAIAAGALWILGSVHFWLHWADVKLPKVAAFILVPINLFAAAACILMLSVARFAVERHNGTWEFLRSQPVPIRRAVAAKWSVSIVLGMGFIALSSGSAWYPIHHVETARPQLTLVHWVAFHAAAVALVLSLLLLLDTLDWGDWLGLRGLATFAVLLPFLWGMQALDHSSRLSPVISGGLAVGCAAIALIAAPRIARESPLPRWRGFRSARKLHYGPDGAWIWAQWRMIRTPVVLLLLPVPLLITLQLLPLLGSAGLGGDLRPLLRPVFATMAFVSPVVLCIAAWFLGCSTTLLSAQGSAETFRWSLPLPRWRAQRLRLIFALALLGLAATPQWGIVLTRSLWLEPNAGAALAWRLSAQLFVAVAILAATHLCSATLPLSSAVRNAGVLSASIALSVFIARSLTLSRPDLVLASTVAIALLILAWAAAPRLERRREI